MSDDAQSADRLQNGKIKRYVLWNETDNGGGGLASVIHTLVYCQSY